MLIEYLPSLELVVASSIYDPASGSAPGVCRIDCAKRIRSRPQVDGPFFFAHLNPIISIGCVIIRSQIFGSRRFVC